MTSAGHEHRTVPARRPSAGSGATRGQDAWAAAGTFVAGLVLLALGLTGHGQLPGLAVVQDAPAWWFVPPLLVGCLAMLVKRAAPVAALSVGAAAFAVDMALGGSIAAFLYVVDLLYSAALLGSSRLRRALWVSAGVLVAGPTVLTVLVTSEVRWGVLMALQQAVLYLGPLWWARDVRTGRELADVAEARADAIERLADAEQRHAVRVERDALARDLHDAVASHLSAIALHAGGALATAADPVKDRAALELTRSFALESMQEMHALIALLREPEQAAVRLPRLADIPELVEQARRTGSEVRFAGPEQIMRCPAPVGLAGYRIVQEALTNAAKHAPGERIEVQVAPSDSRVWLRIHNTRAAAPIISPPARSPGAGFGLTTMRERAAALGGTLHIEVQPGEWTVTAELPHPAGSAA